MTYLLIRLTKSGGAELKGRYEKKEDAEREREYENRLAKKYGLPWVHEVKEAALFQASRKFA